MSKSLRQAREFPQSPLRLNPLLIVSPISSFGMRFVILGAAPSFELSLEIEALTPALSIGSRHSLAILSGTVSTR